MRPYLDLIRRELGFILLKDRRRGALLLFAAAAYLILFGLLYAQGVVRQMPLVVADACNTAASRRLIRGFGSADGFRLDGVVLTQEEAQEYLLQTEQGGRHKAALIIPKDFSVRLAQSQEGSVLLLLDGSNLVVASNAASAALEVLRDFNREEGGALLQRDRSQNAWQAERRLEPLRFSYRVLYNSELDYLYFFVIGLGLIALQNGVLLSVAAGLLYEGQPLTAAERRLQCRYYWLAKSGVYLLLGILSYELFLLLLRCVFSVPLRGSLWQLRLLGYAFIFCLTQWGGALALWLQDELRFSRWAVFYTVPAFMLSGYTWPLEAMPPLVRALAYCSPFTYLASASREVLLKGCSAELYFNSGLLLAAGALGMTVTLRLLARRFIKAQDAAAG